jgi:protein O-mannosyl-transferase
VRAVNASKSISTSRLLMRQRTTMWMAVTLVAVAALLAYRNSLRGPFVFDDGPSTVGNVSIREWKPPWGWFLPPKETTVSGRPVANLTLGFNYALSGSSVWSYHALNLLIHILGGLTLFGILRRTFQMPSMGVRFRRDSLPLALVIALLWILHPLQTEAVTYVVQRVESLMALFYLLTLYFFIRSVHSARPLCWQACALIACLLGMGTKEVMVSAPILVMLYDRIFVAGSLRAAWSQRRVFYLGLAATWLPLAILVASTGWSRHGSAGFTSDLTLVSYWTTQFEGIARYLLLFVWPSAQVFDYGAFLARDAREIAPYALVVISFATLTLVALWRWPKLGYLGAWFFIILAPTCVVPVATQTIAEHRMYLPLASLVTLAAVGAYAIAGRLCFVPLAALALALGIVTFNRNEVYRSEVSLWSDVVEKWPDNARAHCSLGNALTSIPGRLPQAISELETALRIHPGYADAHTDLGLALENVPGRLDEAIYHLREAARIRPDIARSHYILAEALARNDSTAEAIREDEVALNIKPDYVEACAAVGELLCNDGRTADGIRQLEAALRISPNYARAHFFLGNVLVRIGQIPDAIQQFEDALDGEPDFAEASNNLGVILCRIGRTKEGMVRIEAAIRMQPDFLPAHFARAAGLLQDGRKDEAIAELEGILRVRSNDPSASRLLELIRSTH